ncbi:FKBP-type peptidyl-prolyl cis-trans isomerase [Sphingobacterium lumbrici]|uniref:FKBP-type peptidyl-prolyl cis-trans isomerase n=1 Tax=Sphingobacterium lumbrici TaxID=2559600 RepID=UPI00112D285E|nr:FKBP-type peptidyl-prolyl cis-trans isomerase [Sphingobacterium lumbrici]
MKNLFKILFAFAIAATTFTSCIKDNDFDMDKLKEEQRIKDSVEKARVDNIIETQAPILAAYVAENFPEATLIDSLGIWYNISEWGEENSYTYSFGSNGYLAAPTVTVKYTGKLLNGTVFDETEDDKTATFSLAQVIPVWKIAFFPKSIKLNGIEYNIGGLTPFGLQKGARIRFVSSSPWAYDNVEKKDQQGQVTIPENSPLDFTIEVIDIK